MKCWYCQEVNMDEAPELGSGWFQCSICGATWIDVVEPFGPVAGEVVYAGRKVLGHHIKARLTGRKARR